MLRVAHWRELLTSGFFRYAKHLDKRMQKYHAFFMFRQIGPKRTNKDSKGMRKRVLICKKEQEML